MIAKTIICTILMVSVGYWVSAQKKPIQWQDSKTYNAGITYMFSQEPDVAQCRAGELSEAFTNDALAYLNYIRKLHNLLPVSLHVASVKGVQEAALMLAANAEKGLNHHPPKSWRCWTQEGADGCANSNLFGGQGYWGLRSAIDGCMIDSTVPILGHRRWILSPALKSVAFGYVSNKEETATGAVIKITKTERYDDKMLNINEKSFVAYPYHEYLSRLVKKDWLMSFSVPMHKGVDLDNAKISVSNKGKRLSVMNQQADHTLYGESMVLTWQINQLTENTKYMVKIENVIVNGKPQQYEYWFTLVR